MKINLVIVAHPDDEILGFGATGAKLVKRGEVVIPIIMCGGVFARNQRPTDLELFEDMNNANKKVCFHCPVLSDFPNLKMNTIPHIDLV